jgi:glyoxylase-like metal-dependent hydrolase (beta-lactamase superfamily II)
MHIEHHVISIGTLAANHLWDERGEVRTGHATTTLVCADDARILVNPGLPRAALLARLGERTNVRAEEITHVFLTAFEVDHRRGIAAFDHATWLLHEPERVHAAAVVREALDQAGSDADDEVVRLLDARLELLDRTSAADDSIVRGVDLFPLPGVTPGTCGLLLPLPGRTVLLAGDAVATAEHLQQGQVLPGCLDVEQAQESFREAIEIADVIIPGRDNIVLNPVRQFM